jgi:hypothetical protein
VENFDCREHVKLGWRNKTKERAKLAINYIHHDESDCAYLRQIAGHYTGITNQPEFTIKSVLDDVVRLSKAAIRARIDCAYLEKEKNGKKVVYSLYNACKLDVLLDLIDSIQVKERKEYVRKKEHNTRSEEETEGIETISSCGARENLIRDRDTNLYGIALKDGSVLIEPTKNLIELFTNFEESRKIAFLQMLK